MKNRRKSGFTLVEMLCSVLIVLLVSAGVTTGVRLAVNSYYSSIMNSEAQVLSQTLETAVSDKLRNSTIVYPAKGTTEPLYFSVEEVGEKVRFAANEDGQVLVGSEAQLEEGQMKLLPSRAYPNGLKASVEITGYREDSRQFSVTAVIYTDSPENPLLTSSFEVRSLGAELAREEDTP